MFDLEEVYISNIFKKLEHPIDNSVLRANTRIFKTLLLDISKNKKWIAYITESYDKLDKQKKNINTYLTIRSFYELENQAPEGIVHTSIDITSLDNFQEDKFSRFLSISSDGKKISLSCYQGIKSEVSDDNYGCSVFEVGADNIHFAKSIPHNGRGVFYNDSLIIMNELYFVVLDSLYKKLYQVSIWQANYRIDEYDYDKQVDNMIRPTWMHHGHFSIFLPIYNTMFLQHGIVLTCKDNRISLWSISNRCKLLVIPENESLVGFLEAKQWCLTSISRTGKFRIIELESSSTVVILDSLLLKPDTFEVSDVQLVNQGEHLIISGRMHRRGKCWIWFEVWSTVSGLSISATTFKDPSYGSFAINPCVWQTVSEEYIFDISETSEDFSDIDTAENSEEFSDSDISENSEEFSDSDISENSEELSDSDISDGNEQISGTDESECSDTNEYASIEQSPNNTESQNNDHDYSSLSARHTFAESTTNGVNLIEVEKPPTIPKYMGIYSIKYKGRINTKVIGLETFKKKTVVDYDEQLFKGTSWAEDEKIQPNDSEWQLFTKIGTKGFSYLRYLDNKIYCVICKNEYLQLWSLPPHSIDTQLLDLSGKNYFEELLSTSGRLLLLCPLKDPVEANYEAIAKSVTFGGCYGSYERVLVLVELSDNHAKHQRCQEYILPLNLKDGDETRLYDYVFRNACAALYADPNYVKLAKDAIGFVLFKRGKHSKYSKLARSLTLEMLCKMKERSSKYFTTIYGCQTLALLSADEDHLHDILYDILKDDRLSIQKLPDSTTMTGIYATNILIRLFSMKKIDLYNLLLNRLLLSDCYTVDSFAFITETLLYLQQYDQRELLLNTCKKLSFIHPQNIAINYLPPPLDELAPLYPTKNVHNLYTFSRQEQLLHFHKSSNFSLWVLTPILTYLWKFKTIMSYNMLASLMIQDYRKFKPVVPKRHFVVCAVPLVHFNSYYVSPIARDLMKNFKDSTFIQTATTINNENIFNEGDLIFEIMLEHKWKQFAGFRFFIMCSIYSIFFISYTVGVSFAVKVFGYSPGSQIIHSGQITCICLMFTSGFVLLIQEIRQFAKSYSKIYYLSSPYNWIDLACLVLPTIMFISLFQGKSDLNNLNGFTSLILWLQGILKIRVWRFVGVTLETIIQLILEVKEILLIFFLIVCAFTNAFILILMDKEDNYFQEQYSGSIASSESNSDASFGDVSSSNPFTNVFKSFATLWFFIYGVWDPVNDGDAGDNQIIILLSIVFSILTILIFFNLIIVYMSGKVDEIRQKGKKAWTRHFASVVAEIEQLWCFPYERRDRNRHPSYIYYYAHINDINKQEMFLKKETQEIIERLDKVYSTEPRVI